MLIRKLKNIFIKTRNYLYFLINTKRSDYFSDEFYKNKKIIIVGPADTALDFDKKIDINDFDIIVRLNKSPRILDGFREKNRTDILYHCLNEDPIVGGGEIDAKILKRQKNIFILYTYRDFNLLSDFFRIKKKYPEVNLKLASSFSKYRRLKKTLDVKVPTTGVQALNHLMYCDFNELYITGFSFYRTLYQKNYVAAQYENAKSAYNLAKSAGNHDPDKEFDFFIKLYRENRGRKIVLDRFLSLATSCSNK